MLSIPKFSFKAIMHMMKLKNVEGKIDLYLDVVGYQFPDNDRDDWCLLEVVIDQEGKCCRLVDSAIDATELVELLCWFSNLSEGRLPSCAHLMFTEPCISFEFLAFKNGLVRIAVRLSHELRPDFEMQQFGEASNDWCVVIDLDGASLKKISNDIKSSVERFPIRGR